MLPLSYLFLFGRFRMFGFRRLLQPILPVFFAVQFAFLYDGWDNKWSPAQVRIGVTIFGFGILLLAAFAATAVRAPDPNCWLASIVFALSSSACMRGVLPSSSAPAPASHPVTLS